MECGEGLGVRETRWEGGCCNGPLKEEALTHSFFKLRSNIHSSVHMCIACIKYCSVYNSMGLFFFFFFLPVHVLYLQYLSPNVEYFQPP